MRKLALVGMCTFAVAAALIAADEHGGASAGMPSAGKTVGKQTTCPVSGKPIDAKVFVDEGGQKVYFCGKGCVEKFKASPKQYLPAVYKQIYPQRVQLTCPVMGDEINPKVFTDYNGQRVYFCCKECISKFKANPDKYLSKLADSSIGQVHCPVTGEPIDPAVSIEQNGKKVYFCCKACIGKYKADPVKYAEALRPTAGLLAYGEEAKDDLVLCPVCLSKGVIHARAETRNVEYGGMNYAVCNDKCAETFKADSARYAKAVRDEMIKRAGGTNKAFTCSMHLDVVSAMPGNCALCGMKLTSAKSAK